MVAMITIKKTQKHKNDDKKTFGQVQIHGGVNQMMIFRAPVDT